MTEWRAILRWAGYGALALMLLWFAYGIRAVLAPFVLALVLAYILEPPVTALECRGLNRTLAIALIYAGLGLLIAGIIAFLVPGMIIELNRLAEKVPEYTQRVQELVSRLQADYSRIRLPETVRQALDDAIINIEAGLLAGIGTTVEGIMGALMGAFILLLAPFLAFYMIRDVEYFKRHLVALLPDRSQSKWLHLLGDIDRVLSGFIRGQLIIGATIGVAVALIVWALGLRFAILLGMIAGLGEFVPYFGPIIAALPAVAIAALDAPSTMVKMILALFILQQLETAVLAPKVFKDSMGLHPLVVVFALLIGGHGLGLLGMILAVPAAGILKVLLDHLLDGINST